MYSIKIRLQSSNTRSEILPEDLSLAELLIENIVSQALLELFDEVEVEDVVVSLLADESKKVA